MFNSTETNEEQSDIFNVQILSIAFSLMITEVSEYEFIHVLIVTKLKFPLLVPVVVSKYCLLRIINVHPDRKKKKKYLN